MQRSYHLKKKDFLKEVNLIISYGSRTHVNMIDVWCARVFSYSQP